MLDHTGNGGTKDNHVVVEEAPLLISFLSDDLSCFTLCEISLGTSSHVCS